MPSYYGIVVVVVVVWEQPFKVSSPKWDNTCFNWDEDICEWLLLTLVDIVFLYYYGVYNMEITFFDTIQVWVLTKKKISSFNILGIYMPCKNLHA
jgi:hypothetical protein